MSLTQSVTLSVQNHSLQFSFAGGQKHIDFHDTIKKGKAQYHLFHEKTCIVREGNDFVVQTAALNENDFMPPFPA